MRLPGSPLRALLLAAACPRGAAGSDEANAGRRADGELATSS